MSSGQFPIAVGSRPIVPSSAVSLPLRLLALLSSIRAAPLQEITWYTIETRAEVAIYQFPGWTRRRRSRFRFSSPRASSHPFTERGPALMTLENRSLRSLAHCHSSLSHASLIARYLSLSSRRFIPPASSTVSTRGVSVLLVVIIAISFGSSD